ncbi:hypothetical protein SALBM135S_01459 [Streptomyces alboniger]
MADSSDAAGPIRALVIANPASGSHSPRLVREVQELCSAHLAHTELHTDHRPGRRHRSFRAAPLSGPRGRPTSSSPSAATAPCARSSRASTGPPDGPRSL